MRRLIAGLIMVGSAAGALAADRVELPGFYANTWELRRPEETIWVYVNADGTWDGIFDGTFYNGSDWRTVNGNTCFFNAPGQEGPDDDGICFRDLAQHKAGDSWQLTVVGLEKVWNATIYKGRAVPPTSAPAAAAPKSE